MSDMLIIGNGFDLYHMLPTRYTDFFTFIENWDIFIEEYEKNELLKKGETESSKNHTISLKEGSLNRNSMLDFAMKTGEYKKENLEYLNQNLACNLWIKYLQNRSFSNEKWVDFEKEIEQALTFIEDFYDRLYKVKIGEIPLNVIGAHDMNRINILREKTFKQIEFRKPLREEKATKEKIKEDKISLLNSLKEELNILNTCLRIYLEDFVSKIKPKLFSQQIANLEEVRLLNFNYTNTYIQHYGTEKLKEQHCVHGSVSSNNMVLGVSDDFTINAEYIYFMKYFQRIQKKTGLKYNKWILNAGLGDSIYNRVYIVGHSLSETDKGILEKFFNKEMSCGIHIYYHNQESYELQIINLVKMFGKDYIIEAMEKEKLIFIELEPPVESIRSLSLIDLEPNEILNNLFDSSLPIE